MHPFPLLKPHQPRLRLALLAALLCSSVGCVVEQRVPVGTSLSVAAPVPAPVSSFSELSGVRVWAMTAWEGQPARLEERLTPVRVTLENRSGHPLHVGYGDFTLVGGSGFRYSALPPFPVHQPVSEVGRPVATLADFHPARPVGPPRAPRPMYPSPHFRVAHPYVPFFPLFLVWPHVWAVNVVTTQRVYETWPVELPSDDMRDRALPEGALDDGGTVTGYLYYPYTGREPSLALYVALADAVTGASLGTTHLPLTPRR